MLRSIGGGLAFGHLITAAIVLAAALYLGRQIYDGQVLNEDYAVYLQESLNILHGVPLTEMGVPAGVDPDAALRDQAPLAYPPLTPLFYAPFVAAAGLDFLVLKCAQFALLLLAFLLLVACRRQLGFSLAEAAMSAALFVLLPETRSQINDIGSDMPFLFFLVLALIAVEAQLAAPPARKLPLSVLAGLVCFLAFDARNVGIALLPAAAAAALARGSARPVGIALAVPGLTFLSLWLVQSQLLHIPFSYSYVLSHKFFGVVTNLKSFYWHFMLMWDRTVYERIAAVVVLAAAALAGIGILDGLRRGMAAAWFCAVYLAMLLVLPDFDAGLRYIVPLLLFFGAFIVRGGNRIAARAARKGGGAWGAAAAAPLLLLLALAPAAARLPAQGALQPETRQVFAFLQSHTASGSRIAVRKLRSFHLFTGRNTIRPPIAAQASAAMLSRWLADNHVDYLVLKTSPPAGQTDYGDCPASPACHVRLAGTALVFENRDYRVFRIGK